MLVPVNLMPHPHVSIVLVIPIYALFYRAKLEGEPSGKLFPVQEFQRPPDSRRPFQHNYATSINIVSFVHQHFQRLFETYDKLEGYYL